MSKVREQIDSEKRSFDLRCEKEVVGYCRDRDGPPARFVPRRDDRRHIGNDGYEKDQESGISGRWRMDLFGRGNGYLWRRCTEASRRQQHVYNMSS